MIGPSQAGPVTGRHRRAAVLLLALLLPVATAHGDLVSSEPGNRVTLDSPPGEAVLTFSEPVEVPFSTFKLYRLEQPVAQREPDEREWQRLSGLAGAIVDEVLTSDDDSAASVDFEVLTVERRSHEVRLDIQEPLQAGAYVLMWRVLSIDTHVVQGFVIFVVAPEE